MGFKKLTTEGKNFIRSITDFGTNELMSGRTNYGLPHSNIRDFNVVFVAKPTGLTSSGVIGELTTNKELGNNIILWFDKYSELYDLDANIIAAQSHQESGTRRIESNEFLRYVSWAYSGSKSNKNFGGALGISQFTTATIHEFIVENNKFSGTLAFTSSEINAIVEGMVDPSRATSFSAAAKNSNVDTKSISRGNRKILHQNVMDNPEIMIKAQCYLMKFIGNRNNNLASSTLFAFNRGSYLTSKNYPEIIRKAKSKHFDIDEGITYVDVIFKLLGKLTAFNIEIDSRINEVANKGGFSDPKVIA